MQRYNENVEGKQHLPLSAMWDIESEIWAILFQFYLDFKVK